jgi:hypothetical protein
MSIKGFRRSPAAAQGQAGGRAVRPQRRGVCQGAAGAERRAAHPPGAVPLRRRRAGRALLLQGAPLVSFSGICCFARVPAPRPRGCGRRCSVLQVTAEAPCCVHACIGARWRSDPCPHGGCRDLGRFKCLSRHAKTCAAAGSEMQSSPVCLAASGLFPKPEPCCRRTTGTCTPWSEHSSTCTSRRCCCCTRTWSRWSSAGRAAAAPPPPRPSTWPSATARTRLAPLQKCATCRLGLWDSSNVRLATVAANSTVLRRRQQGR